MKTSFSRSGAAVLFLAVLLQVYPLPAAGPSENSAHSTESPSSADLLSSTDPPSSAEPSFSWNLLWAGSWEENGRLTNRGDLKFHFLLPDLILRGEILDRRDGEWPWEDGTWERLNQKDGNLSFLGGLYHQATGSRVLYGALEEWGLGARLRNPWGRALPFAESRKASMADLRTTPSAKEDEIYLYLGSPYLSLPFLKSDGNPRGLELRGFAAGRLDPLKLAEGAYPLGEGTSLSAGLESRLGGLFSLSLEGFHTAGKIPAAESTAWFLESPLLPEREFKLYGLGLLLGAPYFGLSGDAAWSRTRIDGGDLYANLGIRLGNKGGRGGSFWQLSLAADGAGPGYTGSDGSKPGAAFRIGGKFEGRGKKAGFFRINTSLSGPGFMQDGGGDLSLSFDRSSSSLYYRPPAGTLPLRISRISLNAGRDARESSQIRDSAGLDFSLTGNPRLIVRSIGRALARLGLKTEPSFPEGTLTLNLSGALSGFPKTGAEGNPGWGGKPLPWPVPRSPYLFESLKAGAELSWSRPLNLPLGLVNRLMNGPPAEGSPARPWRGNLQIKAGFDYRVKENGEGGLTESRALSLAAALRGRLGSFTVKLNCPDLPSDPFDSEVSLRDAWELSLSWKREWR
jgi:hypothetical protein